MTKTEYREYISSPKWKERRKEFLAAHGSHCANCDLPRLFAIVAYDQDIHVHHVSYARVGQEVDDDLKPLCKRCHEIETFGVSRLHRPPSAPCENCGKDTYDVIDLRCESCVYEHTYDCITEAATHHVLHTLGLFCFLFERRKFKK